VEEDHAGHPGCKDTGIAIATISDAWHEIHARALDAYPVLPEKEGARADNPVMMKCLYHRDTLILAYPIGCGGYEGEDVVEMGDIRFIPLNYTGDIMVCPP